MTPLPFIEEPAIRSADRSLDIHTGVPSEKEDDAETPTGDMSRRKFRAAGPFCGGVGILYADKRDPIGCISGFKSPCPEPRMQLRLSGLVPTSGSRILTTPLTQHQRVYGPAG